MTDRPTTGASRTNLPPRGGSAERPPLPTAVKAVLLAFALVLLVFTKHRADSWADGSRLGTIQGLVEHGTLALDDTDFLWQGDRVLVGGHSYSHQPPMLAVLGAVPYAVLHHGLGLEITDPFTYRALTWTLVGLPLLLGLAALARLLGATGAGPRATAGLLALAIFGTHLLPYSLVLQQHGSSTGFVLLGLAAVAGSRAASAGALLALASTIDLTAAFPALFFAWPLFRRGGAAAVVRYGLGALPVLALHFGINWSLVGDLMPVGLHLEAFDYPYSSFLFMSLTGGEQRAGELSAYVFGALIGKSGYLSHHPIVLGALAAAGALAIRRPRVADEVGRGLLLSVGASIVAIAVYYLTQSRNFGGSAFGMRWFTMFGPLLTLFPAAWLGARPEERHPTVAARVLLAVAAAWSIAAAALGSVQPWAQIAYTWNQKPDAMIANPALVPPTWGEHLRREWIRVTTYEQTFDRESYLAWYEDIVHRHGTLHARDWPGLTPAESRAFVTRGLHKLQHAVDLMESARDPSYVRVAGWFWIGKLHAKLGDDGDALRAYDRALALAPEYGPALKARERLVGRD